MINDDLCPSPVCGTAAIRKIPVLSYLTAFYYDKIVHWLFLFYLSRIRY
jgi:hypothetical protein